MKKLLAAPFLLALAAGCRTAAPDYWKPLPPGAPALLPLAPGEQHPDFSQQWYAREDILPALDNSIAWSKKPSSQRFFPIEGVNFERALKSLEHFREILQQSQSAEDFEQRLDADFTVLKSAGWNGTGGGVLFTGYCTVELEGSLTADATHRYPLYALPSDLVKGPEGEILGRLTPQGMEPYPTRAVIEASALLEGKGLELVWLANPVDAYVAHVNGSAVVHLTDGSMLRLGYSGKNGRTYVSLGQELVKDKQLDKSQLSLAGIRKWASANPDKVEGYLRRNESFVFFAPIDHPPHGSLNVPVTAGRSLATDKRLFPRGAITFVDTKLGPKGGADVHQFLFDQDTGGAIRTAGRADMYLGQGTEAERIAGATRAEGQLYYLFLKQ
ncbi:MAG: MltA domain-containing protein [Planctomycetes bacterium]|nr:MltA domain-containing protein [Planctomycetota bacterium]